MGSLRLEPPTSVPRVRSILVCLVGLPSLVAGAASVDSDAVCAVGDASCRSKSTGGGYFWPNQKGDINRTGLSPYVGPKKLEAGPTWKWTDPHQEVIRFTPLIDDRLNIYLPTAYGRIYKFSPEGEILWTYITERIPAVPAIMDGLLFANTRNGFVFALDMETGRLRWETLVSEKGISGDTACLLAFNGTIIVAAEDKAADGGGIAVALSADGAKKWTFRPEDASFYNFQASAPGDGTIVFQDSGGGVYRLDLETGKLLWFAGIPDRKPLVMTTGAAVVGPNGIVYCASNTVAGGVIHAYRLSDGSLVWRRDVVLPANQAVAVGRLAGGDGLAVVAGIGENPGFPAMIRYVVKSALPGHWEAYKLVTFFLPWALFWFRCCRSQYRECGCGKSRRCCSTCLSWLMIWLLGVVWSLFVWFVVHLLALQTEEEPAWLWGTKPLAAQLLALSAQTGETLWAYTPPTFARLACAGDTELLLPRLFTFFFDKPSDPICLPDSWSQAIIDAEGTVYAGFEDGHLFAVRDEDGDGQIQAESEVSSYDFRAAFQGSQALAPGMLAVAPCGGGLYVWRY